MSHPEMKLLSGCETRHIMCFQNIVIDRHVIDIPISKIKSEGRKV
jgi:hypothetical protein